MTSERALYTALSAMSRFSEPAGTDVNDDLAHTVMRCALLFTMIAVAAKFGV